MKAWSSDYSFWFHIYLHSAPFYFFKHSVFGMVPSIILAIQMNMVVLSDRDKMQLELLPQET